MKSLLPSVVVFSLAILFFGCNPDETPEQSIEGSWELVEIRSQWTQDVQKGGDLNLRETYTFNPNGTFTKTRKDSEMDKQGSGTYTASGADGRENNPSLKISMDLTFNEDVNADLVYGCEDELTEHLYILSDGLLRNMGSCMADVNILLYNKL